MARQVARDRMGHLRASVWCLGPVVRTKAYRRLEGLCQSEVQDAGSHQTVDGVGRHARYQGAAPGRGRHAPTETVPLSDSTVRHLQLERPLAVLDTETTGVDPLTDRIVELAVVRLDPDGAARRYRRLVDPGVPIPPAATAVHGIADADVAGRPRFAAIADRLARRLDGCDLAGFNLRRFDLPLLAAEFARAGVAFDPADRAVVDAQQIYHAREPRDLAAAVRFYCGREHAATARWPTRWRRRRCSTRSSAATPTCRGRPGSCIG